MVGAIEKNWIFEFPKLLQTAFSYIKKYLCQSCLKITNLVFPLKYKDELNVKKYAGFNLATRDSYFTILVGIFINHTGSYPERISYRLTGMGTQKRCPQKTKSLIVDISLFVSKKRV